MMLIKPFMKKELYNTVRTCLIINIYNFFIGNNLKVPMTNTCTNNISSISMLTFSLIKFIMVILLY